MPKTLKQMLEVYRPKAADEQKFVDKHVVVKHDDANGNKDDVFQGTNVKKVDRKKERHGHEPGEDEKVYEEVEQVDEKLAADATAGDYVKDFAKSDAPQFKGKSKEKRRKMAIAAFLNKENVEHEGEDLQEGEQAHAQFQKYHDDSAKLLKGIHGALSKHYGNVTDKKNYNNGMAHWGNVDTIKGVHRSLQDLHDRVLQEVEYSQPPKPVAVKIKEDHELEELEHIEELNKSTLASYVKAASVDAAHKAALAVATRDKGYSKDSEEYHGKQHKRVKGIFKATDRLAKEEVDQLKGKQHKIDKNKNGKIDAQDFKILRKEETEIDLTLLNLYVGLDEDNRQSMIKMIDDGLKDSLVEFAKTLETK